MSACIDTCLAGFCRFGSPFFEIIWLCMADSLQYIFDDLGVYAMHV